MRCKRWTATARWGLIAAVTQVLVLGTGSLAQAGPIIDFDAVKLPGPANSISWGGGVLPLVGNALTFFTVTGEGTPLNNGAPLVVSAVPLQLSFTTGAYLGHTGTSWDFASGGSFTLSGTIPGVVISPTTIYSGTFAGESTVSTIPNSTTKVFSGTVDGALNSALAAYFGLPTGGYDGAITLQFVSVVTPGSKISGAVFESGDLAITPVPEPACLSLSVLGLGAMALAYRHGLMRRV